MSGERVSEDKKLGTKNSSQAYKLKTNIKNFLANHTFSNNKGLAGEVVSPLK